MSPNGDFSHILTEVFNENLNYGIDKNSNPRLVSRDQQATTSSLRALMSTERRVRSNLPPNESVKARHNLSQYL